ncbi:FtsQ-type POTRA domain-containing protein [bacterium]|nr:FtsQ-type POTRA domain-containing protein [bacterium]
MKLGWRKSFFLTIVVAAAVAGATYRRWFPDLEWLKIREVSIEVQEPLKEAELRKLLPALLGKNLLLVSADSLIERCLKNPWVSSVAVKKEYPNRLTLIAQSKKAVALKQESGKLIYIDDKGEEIDRWSASRLPGSDLPIVVYETAETARVWNSKAVLDILLGLQKALGEKRPISQLVPVEPPYFKVFLAKPKLELLFSRHTWEAQLPFFLDLVSRPPRRIGQAHKINLVFPKKAVVSLPLSN